MNAKHGQFQFDPPPNIPGGTMIIEDADWYECSKCGEAILPIKLCRQLDEIETERERQ